MGDIRDQATPPEPAEFAEPAEPMDPSTVTADTPLAGTRSDLGQTTSESAPMYHPVGVQQQQHHHQYQQHQQHYSNGLHGFSAQLDTPSQYGQDRAGPFNMGAMSSALPHVPYRPSLYSQGQQPSYNPIAGPSSSIANPMVMGPYGSQPNTSGWTGHYHQWLLSQHTGLQHVGHYHNLPLSPSPQVRLASRPGYDYPNGSVLIGQQSHLNAPYFYQPGASLAGQVPQAHGQAVPGQYVAPGSQLGAAHSVQPQYGAQVASNSDSDGLDKGKLMMFAHVFVC